MTRAMPVAGYTLIELMVVLAILGVLATLSMPLAEMAVQREKESELKRALWEIRDAIDAYHQALVAAAADSAHGTEAGRPTYPPSLEALTQARAAADSGPALPRFLRRVPRDPFAEPSLPAARTWALRSYASEPDRPAPGADVYDVHSKAAGVGLNGVPLRDW